MIFEIDFHVCGKHFRVKQKADNEFQAEYDAIKNITKSIKVNSVKQFTGFPDIQFLKTIFNIK